MLLEKFAGLGLLRTIYRGCAMALGVGMYGAQGRIQCDAKRGNTWFEVSDLCASLEARVPLSFGVGGHKAG